MTIVKKFIVNPLQENSFVLYDHTGECIIVDAGFYFDEERDELEDFLAGKNLRPVKLINTHCHFDHLMGVKYLTETLNIPFACHQSDEFLVEKAVPQGAMFGFEMEPAPLPDHYIDGGSEITFGESKIIALHVPGHSPGHLVFYSPTDGFIIAGDVLFYGSIGRTDLPGGNYQQLISNIKEKLLTLPGDTRVYCGHGPETTIAFEKNNNPFLV